MKILITGVNGFIGLHLARALVSRNHSVRGLGRKKRCELNIHAYFSGDIMNKQLLENAMDEVDVVVHLAALTAHEEIVDNKFETLELNFLGTKNVLDVFSRSQSARKFIYSSTGKVYGDIKSLPISEEHPLSPLNVLGKSKFITEKLIDFYSNSKKAFVIFRIFNVYGPHQKKNFLIPTILSQIEEDDSSDAREITVGDIKAKRDYVYIEDVVNAFVSAIDKNCPSGTSVFNICTGKGANAEEIVSIIGQLRGLRIKTKTNPDLVRRDERSVEYGSYSKAEKILGWKPKYNLENGLRKMMENESCDCSRRQGKKA